MEVISGWDIVVTHTCTYIMFPCELNALVFTESQSNTVSYSIELHFHKKTQSCNTFIQEVFCSGPLPPFPSFLLMHFIAVAPLFFVTYSLCLLCMGLYVHTTFSPHLPFSCFSVFHISFRSGFCYTCIVSGLSCVWEFDHLVDIKAKNSKTIIK